DPQTLQLPYDLPDGRYALLVALPEAPAQRAGFLDLRGREHVFAPPAPAVRLNVAFGGAIRLLGYDARRQDGRLDLTLYWQAAGRPTQDLAIFVHLLGAGEAILAQRDSRPQAGR